MRKYLFGILGYFVELVDGIYGRQLIYRKITQFIAKYYFIVPIKIKSMILLTYFLLFYTKNSYFWYHHPSMEDEHEIKGQKLIF